MEENLPPIPDQKTLMLVNTFIVQTVQLLNRFATTCEDKLAEVSRRIQRIEVRLTLLEAQLASTDGPDVAPRSGMQSAPLDALPDTSAPDGAAGSAAESSDWDQTPSSQSGPRAAQRAPSISSSTPSATGPNHGLPHGSHEGVGSHSDPPHAPEAASEPRGGETPSSQSRVKDDPALVRFFRMLAVGVPEPAVKMQMSIEGLDPSLLDDPEAPVATLGAG